MLKQIAAVFSIGAVLLTGCAMTVTGSPSPTPSFVVTPAIIKTNFTTTPTSSVSSAPSITNVTWDYGDHFIKIGIAPWPKLWSSWKMLVDGVGVSMDGETGDPVVRPNAPLDQPPDGLIVGTLPWLTGLENVDFPCCGTLQFSVPDLGLTNSYD
jgi:hypothetical protein